MFVVEHRNRLAGAPERVRDLKEEFETRIELLLLVVEWVVAVLADQQNAVHGEVVSAKRQRLMGRAKDGYVVSLLPLTADVALALLVRKDRHDVGTRPGRLGVEVVSEEVAAEDRPRVRRAAPQHGCDRGKLLGFGAGHRRPDYPTSLVNTYSLVGGSVFGGPAQKCDFLGTR